MLFGPLDGQAATYERLIALRDDASGLQAVLVIDSTRRGAAFGGIRRRAYDTEVEAVADARRLARSMSRKCALAQLEAGGAKTVVLAPEGDVDWPAAYAALGRAIEGLGGTYVAGPDVGTGPAELAAVRAQTEHVNPDGNDAGASTAAGVLAGLAAVSAARGAAPEHVAIQGLGSVGRAVATSLITDGVRVTGADPDPGAQRAARALGVELVGVAAITDIVCDVFMPCAMGQCLHREVAAALRCAAVCGSANDQLADAEAAAILHARGILHAPDIVVSAGAVIEGVLTVQRGTTDAVRAEVAAHIAATTERLARVFARARAEDRPPSAVAVDMADAQLLR